MCARLIGVFAGNPLRVMTNVAVAAVIWADALTVVSIVIVTEPLPTDSAPLIGGTSLAGDSVAVNVGLAAAVVGAVDELPHPAAKSASDATRTGSPFI